MKRILLSASALLLAAGCSQSAVMQPKAADEVSVPAELLEPWDLMTDGHHDEPASASHGRQQGDFVVYRFSGSYRNKPVTLTQRVVGRDGEHLVVDVVIDGGGEQQRLRLRVGDSGKRHGDVVSVARLEGDVQRPFGLDAYEAMMSSIVLTADSNDGELGTTGVLVDAGSHELPATKTSYRVRVGAHRAVMSTFAADGFAWGDVGAEIRTDTGKLLYKAEIVDMGGPGFDDAIAASEPGDAYDEIEEMMP